MYRRLSTVFTVLTVIGAGSSALAQERVHFPDKAAKSDRIETNRHWCATPQLMNSPEGRAAIRRFHEARANGTLPRVSKSTTRPAIGSMQTFNILTDSITSEWKPAEFEMKATGVRFNIWLRSDKPDQPQVSDERMEAMRVALDESTPERSIDPTKGVFALDEQVFGNAPIYPAGSDGVVDVLVYELPLGVAGFVSPTDIDPFAPSGDGNQSEILHIWIEGFERDDDSRIESVTGHEYQHLIHSNYDTGEIQFVNEGLSEYAQLLLGYQAIVPAHLSPPAEYNISFFSWRDLSNNVILDYMRSSTWHGYLGDQLGPEITGSITRHPQIGLEGYKAVLAEAGVERSMDDLIVDFYTALIVNDLSVDSRFGIVDPIRSSQIDIELPSNRRFSGSAQTQGNLDSLVIQPGGTEYIEWKNVTDLSFTFDVKASPDFIEARRATCKLRIITEAVSGDIQILDFAPGPDANVVEGDFKSVILVAANVRPEVVALPAFLESSWTTSTQVVSYDYLQGVPYFDEFDGALAFSLAAGSDGAFAVRFPVPPGGQLSDVEMSVFHFNEWGQGPLEAPRDYLLTVWGPGPPGFPGQIIYSEVFEDPNPATRVEVVAYRWQSFKFNPAISKSVVLPDTVYIGAREVGVDDNYMVLWPGLANRFAFPDQRTIDVSYVGSVDQATRDRIWVPSWEVTFQSSEEGDRPLRGTALPVRATFVVDPTTIAVEGVDELPATMSLSQNFPNPFNPSTRIEFMVPDAQDVQLKVFDITGREVVTLVDGPYPAGTYTATLNAADWASGVYVYRLQAGDKEVVKRMVLLK